MSKGPIKYSDFFDDDVKAGLQDLNQVFSEIKVSAAAMKNVFVAQLKKSGQEVVKMQAELEKLKEKLQQVQVSNKGAAEAVSAHAKESEKLIAKHKEAKAAVNDLTAIIDVHTLGLKECKDTIKALEKEYSELSHDTKENKERQQQLIDKIKQVSVQFNKLNGDLRNAKRNIEQIDGTYSALSRETELLKKELQNLPNAFDKATGAINKNNKEAAELQKQIELNVKALKKMDEQMGMHYRNVGNYSSALAKLGGIGSKVFGLLATAIGFDSLQQAVTKIYEITLQLDSLNTVMKYTSGSTDEFNRNMDFLNRTTDHLGLEFMSTSNAFRLWTGAAKESNLTSSQTRWIFESVAKATATMRMSADDTQGVFLALSQMLSKGKVSAEELRGQLGERLPGAFAMAAQAIGVTEQELDKMLKNGEVVAYDFLPKFAAQLDKTFGNETDNKVVSLQGSVNRFQNSITKVVSSAQLQDFLMGAVDGATKLTNAFADLIATEPAEELQKEKLSLIAMRIELDSTNTSAARRREIIESLKATYPAYLEQIDAEKVTNAELLPILDKINDAYVLRIAYQERATKLDKAVKEEAEAMNNLYDDRQTVLLQLAKIQEELANDGITFEIKGNNEREKSAYIYQNLISYIQKEAKEHRELHKVLASNKYDILISGLNSYNNSLVNSNRLLLQNRNLRVGIEKDLKNFREQTGMFDGTNNDEQTQRYDLSKTFQRIYATKVYKKAEKDALANRIAQAGYDKETQYEILQEIERRENDLASKVTDTKTKTSKQLAAEAKKRFNEMLALIQQQEQMELLQLQNSYGQQLISEAEFEKQRLEIRKKALLERQKLLNSSSEKSHLQEAKMINDQLKALDVEYGKWKKDFDEKQLQNKYDIELASLEQIYATGTILESEYQKRRTDILVSELERRLKLETDAVKRAQLQSQIAQTKKEGADKFISVNGTPILKTEAEKDVTAKASSVQRKYETDQSILSSRETKGEDVTIQRLLNEAQMLQELRALYKSYGKDVTDIDQQIARNVLSSNEHITQKQLENIDKIKNVMMQSVDVIRDYLGEGWGNLFGTLADQLFEFVKKGKIQFKDLGEAVAFYGEMAKSVGQVIFQFQIDQSEKRIEVLESEKERVIELETAGIEDEKERARVKQQIEADYNAKIRAEKKKQAQAERNNALFQIAINTAMGITMALAQLGPIAGIIMAAVVGGIGIAQAAMVMSKPLAYWTGTRNSEEGIADVAERGHEIVKDSRTGKMTYYKDRTRIYIPKGSQVFNARETDKMLERMKIDRYSAANREMALSVHEYKRNNEVSIMAEAFKSVKIDEAKLADAIGARMSGLPITNWTVDENGFRKRIRKGNTTVEMLNKRNSLK
ncbi:hypothetical protein BWD42_04025 [Sphingobacterium sp. CZ-UAM]|uniref:tape measure protein n=1 Tax=Sphingobacterium sp. CZ-UAM TaxID=1933868 RepID=UPI00098432FA|nr:tape measure protein [Sphingobacterium sp. CZ-UAM]OOG19125.1 hypothetical protein BWD42_04025 [Sphingobacterium sp. CZ-UAM]